MRDGCSCGRALFARRVIRALAACLLFGIGGAAPAASDPLGEVDEADVLGDLDPRNRVSSRMAIGPHAAGPCSHVIVLPAPSVPDATGSFPTRHEGGLGRDSLAPERLTANLGARRLPGANPKEHAVPGSPSNPVVREIARTLEVPLEAVVIPGHPNFTQLTTGPPSTGVLRFLPVAALDVAGRPRLAAESVSSAASIFGPARLPAMPAVIPAAPSGAFENSEVRSRSTNTSSLSAGSEPANPNPHLTLQYVVRTEVTIAIAAIEVLVHMVEAMRTP